MIGRIAAIALGLLAFAQPAAAQQYFDANGDPLPVAIRAKVPGELRGASVYIYSFLDVRDMEFGSSVLEMFREQIAAGLAGKGVKTTQIWFRDTRAGANFDARPDTDIPPFSLNAGAASSTAMVPVGQVIAANRAKEAEAGAGYRLIVYPSNYTTAGLNQEYKLVWQLVDIATGEQVWRYRYTGRHALFFGDAKRAGPRARKLVDAALASMEKAKLF